MNSKTASAALILLLLAGCSKPLRPVETSQEAKAALRKRLGPNTELHYISTTIRHGSSAICGYAGDKPIEAPNHVTLPSHDHRFIYARGQLTLDSDVEGFEFERKIAADCPSFAGIHGMPWTPVAKAPPKP
jgi:hypothetical protein